MSQSKNAQLTLLRVFVPVVRISPNFPPISPNSFPRKMA